MKAKDMKVGDVFTRGSRGQFHVRVISMTGHGQLEGIVGQSVGTGMIWAIDDDDEVELWEDPINPASAGPPAG